MNKIKKVVLSFSIFITGMISKIYANFTKFELSKDGIGHELEYAPVYYKLTILEKCLKVGKIAIPVILFCIGLFVILSKKLTKQAKVIAISGLLALGVIMWYVMTYLANNC